MNENIPISPRRELSAEEQASRNAYVAAKLEAECKQKRMTIMIGAAVVIFCAFIGWYAVKQHQVSVIAQQDKLELQQSLQKLAQQQSVLDKQAREYEQFYAGKVQSYNSIMGSRNLIPNLPVRQRDDIEREIGNVQRAIESVKSQMKSAITTQNYSYRESNGRSGSGTTHSYNNAEMNAYLNRIKQYESELAVLLAELQRDDYFTGRIAGNQL
jgi:hypothetical protein